MSPAPENSPLSPANVALPPQERGRTRRAQIVRATALLIDSAFSTGRRGLTLRGIAEAAETPVASIYHYFPDVDSIVAAVAAEYGSELSSAVEAGVSRPTASASSLLDTIFAVYREFFSARPGLRELWFDRKASDKVVEIHRHFRAGLAKILGAGLDKYSTKPHDLLTYQTWIEITGILWEMAFQCDPEGDNRVIAEISEVSKRFLHRRLGITFPPSAGTRGRDREKPAASHATSSAPAEESAPRTWELPPPPQARGRKNRTLILAAASALINAQGPHGPDVNVRAIAGAAGTSPGSIYRYFEDLDSLVAAVAAAYMHDLLAVLDEVEDASEGQDYGSFNKRKMAAYQAFFARRPGLRELWFDRRTSEKVQETHAHYRRILAERNHQAMARYSRLPGEMFGHTLHIEVTGALWDLAFTLDPQGHPYVIDEIEELGIDFVRRLREREN
ncbi:TetR/AcrR family transcriptional regulator [Amycolatopsis rhabdoformis]|uniref:TetR/AcrR family transcriptional regulator n=1 Tax=Amycolatopsis rhabdoformis TaxID=1448059 RepID=A0ABZ1I9V3_9PSEU|nr:TetR/AcrR family transcriptional regulator [Amycolatopsis rhabdoformis]WSE31259.1 TetR/AcrR family transcriptional regulator [Amycolatopsis rhabdoformis]